MSFGIGLGSFVQGFRGGMEIRDRLDARADERALKAIDTEAKAQFQEEVDAGTQQPEDFETFWNDYALPRRRNELMSQGDYEGAERLAQWGETTAARKGGKLFSSAMVKANTGDYAGALKDAIDAANVKGYVDHGYELKAQKEITDADGNVIGYRLTVHDGKKDIEQDVAVADIPKLIATFTNPDAAWASQQAAAAKQTDRKEGIEDYEVKKKIDRKYPSNTDGDYAKRFETTRKAVVEEQLLADEPLDDAGIDKEVERRIQQADDFAASKASAADAAPADDAAGIGAVSPAPARAAPAGKKIVVDTVTGQPVDPASAAGLGQSPAPQASPAPAPARAAPQQQTRAAPSKADLIADAADQMATGGNPEYVAMQLNNAGVAQEEWPEQLRAAFTRGTAGAKPESMAAGIGGY